MNNRIISKQDAKILHAALEVLERLNQEYNNRYENVRKSTTSSTYQEYWNAKRKWYYFVKACNKHNIDHQLCSGKMILVS